MRIFNRLHEAFGIYICYRINCGSGNTLPSLSSIENIQLMDEKVKIFYRLYRATIVSNCMKLKECSLYAVLGIFY